MALAQDLAGAAPVAGPEPLVPVPPAVEAVATAPMAEGSVQQVLVE